MAVYLNLVVDCGQSEALVERIRARFEGYLLDLSPLAPVPCSTVGGRYRGRWFAGVQPPGLGWATVPHSEGRPELAAEPYLTRIKELLYGCLAEVGGFDRAYFGGEAWDTFGEEEEEWMGDLWARGMIIAERLVADRFPRADFVPFARGYLRWLPREPAFDLPVDWAEEEVSGGLMATGTVPGEDGVARFRFVRGSSNWNAGSPAWFARPRTQRFERMTAPLSSEDLSTPDLRITLLEAAGTLDQEASTGEPAKPSPPSPAWRLLHALVEAPGLEWTFEVAGPDATVAAARAPFVRLLRGLRRD